ncbi:MAG TPA: lipopolysaccharide assembly protein LapB [Ramlibacter sp.]|jgi:lipopolysaccharide biosynthesis regulator YciM|uniref:lipopolysaccharide assembly protein LapB n=1 Tax=Ramlibacter sp. TaxID=1917967 RepID=UPI002D40447D|nr:lipopolysaccharide assembly protein LapB [Ramlibacter sp.]HZY20469.1 lipopolysaccharide assembly protein LapB [Ramlibacter sp.]
MDFDLSWLLWGLPIAFVLGWLASRLDLRQLRMENRQAPKAYFRGLNFLLNEQQDQAIDAFIEAVRNDPDTSELHFALGNLFRRRGEYERAVRVHEHLLSRGDLSRAERHRAQHALALDFLKAGLLDRAEEALRKLEGTAYEGQALLALLAIYERSRDWAQAADVARKLETAGQGNFSGRRAHYLCELAAHAADAEAEGLLREAMTIAPGAARPVIELAALQRRAGDGRTAFETLARLAQASPASLGLIARPLAQNAAACGLEARALVMLQAGYDQSPTLDVLEAIVTLVPADEARQWYARHLEREPSLVAASKWLAGEKLEHEQYHPQVQRALEHAARPLVRYRCAACGFEAKQHFWQCPGCQAWDSYPPRRVEEL